MIPSIHSEASEAISKQPRETFKATKSRISDESDKVTIRGVVEASRCIEEQCSIVTLGMHGHIAVDLERK